MRKKGYVVSERFQKIAILYAQECVEDMRKYVRNIVIHKKSATFIYAIGEIDIFPSEGIDFNRSGWIKGNDFEKILIENMAVLKEALQIAYDIVCLGDQLVHIGNENKTYRIILLQCTNCKNNINMTNGLYKLMSIRYGQINCPKCKNRMNYQSEGKTSESKYNQVLYHELDMFFLKKNSQKNGIRSHGEFLPKFCMVSMIILLPWNLYQLLPKRLEQS